MISLQCGFLLIFQIFHLLVAPKHSHTTVIPQFICCCLLHLFHHELDTALFQLWIPLEQQLLCAWTKNHITNAFGLNTLEFCGAATQNNLMSYYTTVSVVLCISYIVVLHSGDHGGLR